MKDAGGYGRDWGQIGVNLRNPTPISGISETPTPPIVLGGAAKMIETAN
jgi:hypothetical protein